MDQNEEIIILQLKEGLEEAYKYIYNTYYVSLCHIANNYLKDAYQSEIIVGDTIFHLWEIRDSLQVQTTLLGYLITAVRNRSINYLSSARVKHEVPVSHLYNEDDSEMDAYATSRDFALDGLLEKELNIELERAICALPAECKIVFVKSRFEKKRYEEISQELGISVNTVKYHIKNALRFLRERLGKYAVFILFFDFF
ncbi:MAG TPA: RNA polymerase sigma-70 factor [Arachidicoccus sp.]|nr:RNA polymerase sigma-70 factor [Arachidicoccus sp.]